MKKTGGQKSRDTLPLTKQSNHNCEYTTVFQIICFLEYSKEAKNYEKLELNKSRDTLYSMEQKIFTSAVLDSA